LLLLAGAKVALCELPFGLVASEEVGGTGAPAC